MPSPLDLPIPMRALLAGARRKQRDTLNLVGQLVSLESPSSDKAAVDACITLAAARARALGGRVKLYRQRELGNVLEARFGPKSKAAKPTLLLGHLDTVWPSARSKPCPAA